MRFHAIEPEATRREFVGWTTLWRRSFAIKLAGSSHLPQAQQPIGSAAGELILQVTGTVNKPSFVMVHYAARKASVRMAIAAPMRLHICEQSCRKPLDWALINSTWDEELLGTGGWTHGTRASRPARFLAERLAPPCMSPVLSRAVRLT